MARSGTDRPLSDRVESESTTGMVKTEPMAQAAGVEAADVASVRPAASADGSHNTCFSTSQSKMSSLSNKLLSSKERLVMKSSCIPLLFGAVIALLAPCPFAVAEKPQAAGDWQVLFDGNSLDHFRNYQSDTVNEGWKIVDGAVTRMVDKSSAKKSRVGDLITKEKYGAFELELEFKISSGGNSGLMYHVTEDNEKPWHSGPEIQIIDNVGGKDGQKTGWLYQMYSTETDATKPAGQWNHLRIVISPAKCEHYVNGTKYFEYVKGSDDWNKRVAASKFSKQKNFGLAKSGHICLQDHGNEVAFRNIRVKRLSD